MVKSPPANVADIRDVGSIPGSGRSPGRGHGNPLQYSYLENPMDRGASWATVHRVAESDMTERAHATTQVSPFGTFSYWGASQTELVVKSTASAGEER